jgi:hypothetical protein
VNGGRAPTALYGAQNGMLGARKRYDEQTYIKFQATIQNGSSAEKANQASGPVCDLVVEVIQRALH